jgi:nitroreductase
MGDFVEAVRFRRSIRKYLPTPVDENIMREAFELAFLAPNSSNMQCWDFYWVRTDSIKKKLVENCFGQSAARTAAELVVVTADPNLWKRARPEMIKYTSEINAPKQVQLYYEKLIPITYRSGFLNWMAPFKILATTVAGLFRPVPRGPHTKKALEEVVIKSAALAAENFVLALANHKVSTCMMEGFDEYRVRKLLKLPCSTRIVMVIGCGHATENGTWGPQFRIDLSKTLHEI